MRKIIYQTISNALLNLLDESQQPVINHVSLWNNQLLYAEEEQPFNTPAVFIEFRDIAWNILPHGRREAVVTVNLHVVTDSRLCQWADAVDVFDLIDRINATIHGLTYSDEDGKAMDALTCIASSTDSSFDELQDNIETYSTHVTDTSAFRRHNTPTNPPSIKIMVSPAQSET
ncbi:MAG: hypothetical protein MJZ81_01240 [Bacteroidales bacterium]|nr:hypothetical protein [Bacteroidales bacterium]